MYDRRLREEARQRIARGEQFRHVATDLGVALSTVFKWTRRSVEIAKRASVALLDENVGLKT